MIHAQKIVGLWKYRRKMADFAVFWYFVRMAKIHYCKGVCMKIAIVGATGLVGESLCEIVSQKMPKATLQLYGNTSVGTKVTYANRRYIVLPVKDVLENLPDVAMFMANESVSREYVPQLAKRGVICIDNSSYFRLHQDVPLVVPTINGQKVRGRRIIANPNCTTIQVAMALSCLTSLEPYKMTVVTYQAVSGAGREGLEDYRQNRQYGKLKAFAHPIVDNVLPLVGEITPNGYSTEEIKMQKECCKILNIPIAINCFCARVPVSVGHCAFVNVQFEKPFTLPQVKKLLQGGKDVLTFFEPYDNLLPMPLGIRNSKYVGVGRVFRDQTTNGINMFVVADNLLRGASYNAYEILQLVAQENGWE